MAIQTRGPGHHQPASPPPQAPRQTHTDTSCKPGAHVWQSAALLGGDPGKRSPYYGCGAGAPRKKDPAGSMQMPTGEFALTSEAGRGDWGLGRAVCRALGWSGVGEGTGHQLLGPLGWGHQCPVAGGGKGEGSWPATSARPRIHMCGCGWREGRCEAEAPTVAQRTPRQAPAPGPAFPSSPLPIQPCFS